MKTKLIKLLMLLLVISVAFCFSACSSEEDPNGNPNSQKPDDEKPEEAPENDSEEESEEEEVPLSGLVLIEKGKAKFKVVTTSSAGSDGIRAAKDFVTRLRELGAEVSDVISDSSAEEVTECEIIVGAGVKHRPDECNVSKSKLGDDGYIIKAVGSRVVIAGATGNITKTALNKFIEEYLGIKADTASLKNVAVAENLNVSVLPDYNIDSIKIAGNDISQYVIVCDQSDPIYYPETVTEFQNMLIAEAGARLNIKNIDSVGASEKKIIFKTVGDAGSDGFRVRVSGNDLIIECAYPLLFKDAYDAFVSAVFKAGDDELSFTSAYSYTTNISVITYAEFGAVGDGVTNDFLAIYNAHVRANETKQTIIPMGTLGNVFYIGQTWDDGAKSSGKSIPIKTNVDFGNATFKIDDSIANIHLASRRQKHIFTLARESEVVTYKNELNYKNQISSLTQNPTLSCEDTEISWLKDCLTKLGHEQYMVTFKNSGHSDFVRFGNNQNDGDVREDRVIIDKNGKISSDTPIIFEFTNITEIQIIAIDDSPITVQGGRFETTVPIHDYETKGLPNYEAYSRGFLVQRANSTIKNIDHEVFGEPTGMYHSYPSYGFVAFNGTYNSTLSDSKLCGRQVYKGGKAAASSAVDMGSYDLTMNDSINIYFDNLTQYRDIKDEKYWGLSASNGCKNLYFDNVEISRIDAHCGLWNLEIKNSTIGFAINVIGGGVVNIENTTKLSGNAFISLRNDYGATFNGTVNLKDCTLVGYKKWKSNSTKASESEFTGAKNTKGYIIYANYTPDKEFTNASTQISYIYRKWNFGYICYMPNTVNLDNFKSDIPLYVFNDVADTAFEDDPELENDCYRITKLITFKNMSRPTICPSPDCTKLREIEIAEALN